MSIAVPTSLPSLEDMTTSVQRDEWRADPVAWVEDELNGFVWSKQQEILESVRDHRRTAVQSCHGMGKSWGAAHVTAWWIACHPPGEAFVVTSAPTFNQVKAILWREIGRIHARGSLPGRLNKTEWWLDMPAGNEEIVAFGRKPADQDPASFQGIHARHVLVLFDEAGGIPEDLWVAADSLISNAYSKFLAIGNPDDPSSEFKQVCQPGSGWNTLQVSAYDTPNFTGEVVPPWLNDLLVSRQWVQERLDKWGKEHPFYISKVLGQFPETVEGGLIPMRWIVAAQNRELNRSTPVELGVDVGGGRDKNVIAARWGPVARIIHESTEPNTMKQCGTLMRAIKKTGATSAKIDATGIGAGMASRAIELGAPATAVMVGGAAVDKEHHMNLRAEMHMGVRKRFQDGDIDIDPTDEELAAQLVDLRVKPNSSGKTQIESKEEMKQRGKSSPDRVDALCLSFVTPPIKKKRKRAGTWGRRDDV